MTLKRPAGDVIDAVEQLLDEGFAPPRLVVLCSSSRLANQLREHTVGGFSFGAWGGRGIAVETIARFKGMEAECVVVALDELKESETQLLAYVGMSRARTVLVVVAPGSARTLLNWSQSAPAATTSK